MTAQLPELVIAPPLGETHTGTVRERDARPNLTADFAQASDFSSAYLALAR